MALFGKKTEKEDKASAPSKKEEGGAPVVSSGVDTARVLRAPRITEKATLASGSGAYVFEVDLRATKHDIARAFEAVYKVKPIKINVAKIPTKKIQSRVRGLFGTKSRGKKAYIYLKEGDTIEIV